jgi:type I restriction enzyme, R subunit
MPWDYSEDKLIEQTAINLFYNRLDWDTAIEYNKENLGEQNGKLSEERDILLLHLMRGEIEV